MASADAVDTLGLLAPCLLGVALSAGESPN